MFAKIISSFGAGAIVKIFRGISGPIFDFYKAKDDNVSARQGTWAKALSSAAQADVEHRKLAMAERANNSWLMALYIMIVFPPVLYFTLYWADSIFTGQVWAIDLYFFTIPIWNWETYVLTAAPPDLVEYGKWIIGIFLGANVATNGIVKGAKVLSAAGIFRGK